MRKLFSRKPPLPVIIALAAGLAVTGFSFFHFQQYARASEEKVAVPVPLRSIPAYTILSGTDFVPKSYVKGTEPGWAAKKPDELVGKISKVTLPKGEPVNPGDLQLPKDLPALDIVGVNIDPARSAGAQQGDLVDVYRVSTDAAGITSTSLVAQNAKVVQVCDSTGQPLGSASVQQAVTGAFKAPASNTVIYHLMVKHDEAPRVVTGGSSITNSIALVKKFAESGPAPAPVSPPQQGLKEEVNEKKVKPAAKPANPAQKNEPAQPQ